MNNVSNSIRRIFLPAKPLPAGMHHYMAPLDDPENFRLHLRIERGGNGILVINASTILHLNQSATEYAYHLVKNTDEESTARIISSRYKVTPQQALTDFRDFKETIHVLISRDDLDPEIFLDIAPSPLEELPVPLRLDCAITYKLPENAASGSSPADRVQRELELDEWNFIIDKAWQETILHILFTGGEPTLREDLPKMIKHAEINGQVTGLLSDGLKLVDQQYLDSLLMNGLDHLLFLLQPENDISWQALNNALKADLFVTTHVTLTPSIIDQVENILERLAFLGGKNLSLSVSDIDLADSLKYTESKAAEMDMKLVWDLPVPFSTFNPVSLIESIGARTRKSWLYIEPDGDVRASQDSQTVLGNFLTDPIDKLWKPVYTTSF